MTMRVAAIGECMLEVASRGDDPRDGMFVPVQFGFGGDTLNTALYLARQGVDVDYHTALGDDRTSQAMIDAWREEGIGVEHVARVAGTSPGLYLVRTDAHGERSFQFWRDQSPARRLCALPDWTQRASRFGSYDWLYFSAITLAILGDEGRIALLDAVAQARVSGVRVAFDSNYRAQQWPDVATARNAIESALRHVDLALPTFDDERALFGDVEPEDSLSRLRAYRVETAVIKLGAAGCLLYDRHGSRRVAAPPVTRVIDTTAAGDAFNAGFLAGLIRGESHESAALRGHRIAGIVIQHRGAIAPKSAMPADALDSACNAAHAGG
jgi:2-dehydro-3-deoxygluconokinase